MSDNKQVKGLGGWLILVGIGVVLTPFKLLLQVLSFKSIFDDGTWELVTNVDSEYYHPLWEPLILGGNCI